MLIQQLRDLVAAGILIRHDYRQVPPKVDHAMTAFGMTLANALMPLCLWGTEHRALVEAAIDRDGRIQHRVAQE